MVRSQEAAEAGASFEAAIALADQGKHKEAEEAFAKISVDGTSSYRMLARFREAAELTQRDPKAAVGLYTSSPALQATGRRCRTSPPCGRADLARHCSL